jgi:formylglycine-generating enzyme
VNGKDDLTLWRAAARVVWLTLVIAACKERTPANTAPPSSSKDATAIADAAPKPTDSGKLDVSSSAPPLPFDAAACVHAPVRADCRDGWCRIPAGCFIMGSPETEWGRGLANEELVAVTLTHSFLIGEHEVTQAQWTALGIPNPSAVRPDGTGDCSDPKCPVGRVTWYEALEFANRLSAAYDPPLLPCYRLDRCEKAIGEGMTCADVGTTAPTLYDCRGFRLATEAEWEYAARAGTLSAFYSGNIVSHEVAGNCYPDDNLQKVAWYCQNSGGKTHPVKQLQPNGFGLYDILGNNDEWVSTEFTPATQTFPSRFVTDPAATFGTSSPYTPRIYRGGGYNGASVACRASNDYHAPGSARGVGLRLVRTVE